MTVQPRNIPRELPHSLRQRLGARCVTDAERLRRYEIPERGEPGWASGLLLPQHEDEVGDILRLATAEQLPLVISAGRTGLVEAQRPEGEVVLSLERLARPLSFELADGQRFEFSAQGDAQQWRDQLSAWFRGPLPAAAAGEGGLKDATITVEAGMAIDALNALVEPLQLVWPLELGASSAASVGGCVSNATAGANAVRYGTAAQLCAAAWGFWASGEASGACRSAGWSAPAPDRLAIDSASVPLEWGLIGTQGVLGVITRVQLRLQALPAQREAVLLPVPDMPAAMHLLARASEVFPEMVEEFEFIGRGALRLVREYLGEAYRSPFEQDPDSPYYVLLQLHAFERGDALAAALYGFLADTLHWPGEHIGYAPLPVLKKIRHSCTEASNVRMRVLGGGRLSFDTATPVARFGDYLSALEAALRAAFPHIEFIAFGHAGVGGAHLHLLGTRQRPVQQDYAALVKLVFDITAGFGGTYSAEHGVGPKWGEEFHRRAPRARIEALHAAKRLRDPAGILNPRSFALDRHLFHRHGA